MTAVFVLRLVRGALARGVVAGRVEAVDTGTSVPCASAEELIALLLQGGAVELAPSPAPGEPLGAPGAHLSLETP